MWAAVFYFWILSLSALYWIQVSLRDVCYPPAILNIHKKVQCISRSRDLSLLKYTDDMALVACLQDTNIVSYCQNINCLTFWFDISFFHLNVTKTKELVMGGWNSKAGNIISTCQSILFFSGNWTPASHTLSIVNKSLTKSGHTFSIMWYGRSKRTNWSKLLIKPVALLASNSYNSRTYFPNLQPKCQFRSTINPTHPPDYRWCHQIG